MSEKDVEGLVDRVERNSLTTDDMAMIKHILHCYFWLQTALLESKISLKRVMSMFGFKKTEKGKTLEPESSESASSSPPEDQTAYLPEDNKASNKNTPEESDQPKKKHQDTGD